MKTYRARQQITMLALSFVTLLHSPLLFAETSPELTTELSAQPGNIDVQYTVDWPLPAGETVRDLAGLFYPKNQRMQQYFIAETIKLNMQAQPELHPSTIFSQDNVIVIPNIKELSKKSAHRIARLN
jgi:hypothetical protein